MALLVTSPELVFGSDWSLKKETNFRPFAIAANLLICYGKNLPLFTTYGERQFNSGEFGVDIMSVGPLVTSQELDFATDMQQNIT